MTVVFIVTFFIVLMNSIEIVWILFRCKIELPNIKGVSITDVLFAYPSWFYQIYFWFSLMEVI